MSSFSIDKPSDSLESIALKPVPGSTHWQWKGVRDEFQNLSKSLHTAHMRIKMFAILLCSVALMIAHDQFYVFLREWAVSDDSAADLQFDGDVIQFLVHAVGTIFAYATKLLLSAAIGVSFIQVFWMQMRKKSHTIPEIDAALSSKTNPFGFASLKAWLSMFLLALIPALGVINSQIVVFTTGSISLRFSEIPSVNCSFYTVNLNGSSVDLVTNDNGTLSPKAQVRGFVTQAIMFDEPLPPVLPNSTNIVSYTVTFFAPDLICTDITSTSNSSQLLPTPSGNSPIPVWNTVYQWQLGPTGTQFSFVTASRGLKPASDGETIIADNDDQVVECVFYNATYTVQINLAENNISLLNSTKHINPLVYNSSDDDGDDNGALNFIALADTFARVLNGTVVFDPTTSEFNTDCSVIAFTQFAEQTAGIPWSLGEQKMTTAIPQLMEQVSMSLLSDSLKTETGAEPLSMIGNQSCTVNALVFHYDALDRTWLLLSYGAGIFNTAVCVLLGCNAISKNGIEENIHFSRILLSLVHPGMSEHADMIEAKEIRLLLEGEKRGKFGMKMEKSV